MYRFTCFLLLTASAQAQQWTINGTSQNPPLTVNGAASIVIDMSDAKVHVRTQPTLAPSQHERALREIIALARKPNEIVAQPPINIK